MFPPSSQVEFSFQSTENFVSSAGFVAVEVLTVEAVVFTVVAAVETGSGAAPVVL